MQGVTVGWAAAACGGRVAGRAEDRRVLGLCLDSRRVKRGDLFVALPGRRADGHAFIPQALRAGAAAVLCRHAPDGARAILVPDPRRALGLIAAAYRRRFPNVRVVAVTGSSGKTTTREMIARVLGVRYKVLQTQGNLNNDLGLPLTLAGLNAGHGAAVLELGMNAPGEIRALARLARPAVGVITNIGDAHRGGFADRRGIARAKAELLAELPAGGRAVLNADDPYLRGLARGRRLTFGRSARADVRITGLEVANERTTVELSWQGRTARIALRVLGAHQAHNAAAAVAAGLACGVPFNQACRALAAHRPSAGMRLQVERAGALTLINDAYNSNPQSAAAALDLLRRWDARGPKWAVLGTMLELGDHAPAAHRALGALAADCGLEGLVAVGPNARDIASGARQAGMKKIGEAPDADRVLGALKRMKLAGRGVVLIKGSRGIHLETVAEQLRRKGVESQKSRAERRKPRGESGK